MTETITETIVPRTELVGHFVVAKPTPDDAHVWVYVIAALPDGKVYGVNIGPSLYTVPASPSLTMADVDTYQTTYSLGQASADVRDALATFLSQSGYPIPGEEDTATLVARAKAEQREEDMSEFNAWKERATETAHEYAEANGLCPEFDRCMVDIGLRPRERSHEVTVRVYRDVTVIVRATDLEQAEEEAHNMSVSDILEQSGYTADSLLAYADVASVPW